MAFLRCETRRRRCGAPLVLSLLCWSLTLTSVAGQSAAVKGGYYRGGTSSLFPASGLDATLYTHLFYAFVQWDNTTDKLTVPSANLGEMQSFSADVKSTNPEVLTLISISAPGEEFGPVLLSNASRTAFINSSISLARSLNFDGLDLDWEFSQSQAEMDAFGSLIGEWRQAAVAEGNQTSRTPLLLTAAVYFNATILYTGKGSYPTAAIAENLDFVNIMTYDYHGTWDVNQTGANTNLYDPSSVVSTDHGITSWLEAGLPPDKAVMGLTLYGRSWTLEDEKESNGLGAPATAAGPAQPKSQDPGVFYYSEVVSFIAENEATVVHNMSEVTGYCYADNVWVSYEDPYIVSNKVLYAKSRSLRGYFFWMISQDNDFEVSKAGKILSSIHLRAFSALIFS